MYAHHHLGNRGESIASTHLQKNGYRILEQNWRYDRAEIDIVAQKDDLLVIVEVKTRSTDFFGDPSSFVNERKQTLLMKAAEAYLEQHALQLEVRFDVVGIVTDPHRPGYRRIHHIPDAFSAFG